MLIDMETTEVELIVERDSLEFCAILYDMHLIFMFLCVWICITNINLYVL
jgi:hypothetical protein